MNFIRKMGKGVLLCFAIAVPSWFLGELVPAVGAPVFGILFGMILALLIKDRSTVQDGIGFVSKKVLQTAVVFLGFGLNLSVIWETGKQSLPIIVTTIAAALAAAYVLGKVMKIPGIQETVESRNFFLKNATLSVEFSSRNPENRTNVFDLAEL